MSSPASAHTAREYPSSPQILQNDVAGDFTKLPRRSFYRPNKPLTYELRNHSAVFLEDRQYTEGFNFLDSLLVSGISISTPQHAYQAFVAPPSQLALASTLIAYPHITTKARSAQDQKGADAALRYLRNVCRTIDPASNNLIGAFTFPIEGTRRRGGGWRNIDVPESDDEHENERLGGIAANQGSIWLRAEDFWHIVGWAFNCSVLFPRRWERWKLWLEVMLDFIEADWARRIELRDEVGSSGEDVITSSLIWTYITSLDLQSRSTRRRIVRAVLAMASSKSQGEFPEVWQDETRERKLEDDDNEISKPIDIDNDDFGDYERDDEEEMMDGPGLPRERLATLRNGRASNGERSLDKSNESDDTLAVHSSDDAVKRLGGPSAIELRQRLIVLLVQVAQALPSLFTTLDDLLDIFTECFRPLPTIIFSMLLSTSKLPKPVQTALHANLVLPLVTGKLPTYIDAAPSQEDLEIFFLPASASTHSWSSNAKISVILEHMFADMMTSGSLQAKKSLRMAVEKGISARGKAYGDGRKKRNLAHEEEQSRELMDLSKDRLLGLLEILELATGKDPQPYKAPSQQPADLLPITSSLSSAISMSSPMSESTVDSDSDLPDL